MNSSQIIIIFPVFVLCIFKANGSEIKMLREGDRRDEKRSDRITCARLRRCMRDTMRVHVSPNHAAHNNTHCKLCVFSCWLLFKGQCKFIMKEKRVFLAGHYDDYCFFAQTRLNQIEPTSVAS